MEHLLTSQPLLALEHAAFLKHPKLKVNLSSIVLNVASIMPLPFAPHLGAKPPPWPPSSRAN